MVSEEVSFSTLTSFILFLFTVGTGYGILFLSYFLEKRVKDWYDRDSFDKALQSFFIGAFVSVFTMSTANPPLDSGSFAEWATWLNRVGPIFFLAEIVVTVTTMCLVIALLRISSAYATKQPNQSQG